MSSGYAAARRNLLVPESSKPRILTPSAHGSSAKWWTVFTHSHGLRSPLSKLSGWSAVRPALCYDLCAGEEADAVLAILVKVAES
jgi:hypothetical protein